MIHIRNTSRAYASQASRMYALFLCLFRQGHTNTKTTAVLLLTHLEAIHNLAQVRLSLGQNEESMSGLQNVQGFLWSIQAQFFTTSSLVTNEAAEIQRLLTRLLLFADPSAAAAA